MIKQKMSRDFMLITMDYSIFQIRHWRSYKFLNIFHFETEQSRRFETVKSNQLLTNLSKLLPIQK